MDPASGFTTKKTFFYGSISFGIITIVSLSIVVISSHSDKQKLHKEIKNLKENQKKSTNTAATTNITGSCSSGTVTRLMDFDFSFERLKTFFDKCFNLEEKESKQPTDPVRILKDGNSSPIDDQSETLTESSPFYTVFLNILKEYYYLNHLISLETNYDFSQNQFVPILQDDTSSTGLQFKQNSEPNNFTVIFLSMFADILGSFFDPETQIITHSQVFEQITSFHKFQFKNNLEAFLSGKELKIMIEGLDKGIVTLIISVAYNFLFSEVFSFLLFSKQGDGPFQNSIIEILIKIAEKMNEKNSTTETNEIQISEQLKKLTDGYNLEKEQLKGDGIVFDSLAIINQRHKDYFEILNFFIKNESDILKLIMIFFQCYALAGELEKNKNMDLSTLNDKKKKLNSLVVELYKTFFFVLLINFVNDHGTTMFFDSTYYVKNYIFEILLHLFDLPAIGLFTNKEIYNTPIMDFESKVTHIENFSKIHKDSKILLKTLFHHYIFKRLSVAGSDITISAETLILFKNAFLINKGAASHITLLEAMNAKKTVYNSLLKPSENPISAPSQ